MAESDSAPAPQPAAPLPRGNSLVAVVSAWLLPGLGHIYLRRRLRGLAFLILIATSILVGCKLEGNLYTPVPGQPLTYLATIGSMGMGFPYFLLRYGLSYQGDIRGAAYEYGTAFLLTAGLMNWLLVLDAWDIVRGRKE